MFQEYVLRKREETERLVACAYRLRENAHYLEISDESVRIKNIAKNALQDPVYKKLEQVGKGLLGLCASECVEALQLMMAHRTMKEPLYTALSDMDPAIIKQFAEQTINQGIRDGNSRAESISVFENMILDSNK